jgi:hypothetical protein
MKQENPSPFARPTPGLRTQEGSPPIHRPTEEEMATFQGRAASYIGKLGAEHDRLIESGRFHLDNLRGKNFLIAGGTGSGLGGCLATALLKVLGESGTLTILSRDPSHSITYEMGACLQKTAEEIGFGERFHWANSGMALEGRKLEKILSVLGETGAERVIYINTVAAAHSGLLPGFPPVFVKDVDGDGLFQWQLAPLEEKQIESTRFNMGTMAVEFPRELERAGVQVEATAFADWRGSLDRISRDPSAVEYGRQGSYSTSLYLPKDIVQKATREAYGSRRVVLDVFFPVMKTRALSFIPGGAVLSCLYDKLMKLAGIRPVDTPELALGMLEILGRALSEKDYNPFPRLDCHESQLDLWFCEVVKRLNDDSGSDFYWGKWIECRTPRV